MQKIIVERVTPTHKNKPGFKTVMVRREVLPSEMTSGSKRRTSFLGTSTFERKGRVALFNMSDADIAKFGIKENVDLNEAVSAELGEQAVQVIETTDPNSFGEDIALGMSEKQNPETEAPILHNNQQVFSTTILCPAKYFAEDGGDIRLSSDTVAE